MMLSRCSWTTLTQCCPRKWMSDPAGYAVVLTADRGRFATRKLYKSKNTVTGTCEKLLWDLRRSAPDLPDEMGRDGGEMGGRLPIPASVVCVNFPHGTIGMYGGCRPSASRYTGVTELRFRPVRALP